MRLLLDDNKEHTIRSIRYFNRIPLDSHNYYVEYRVDYTDNYRCSIMTIPMIKKEVILDEGEEIDL